MSLLGYFGIVALVCAFIFIWVVLRDHERSLQRAHRRMSETERRVNVLVSKTGINTAELPPAAMFQDQGTKTPDTFCD